MLGSDWVWLLSESGHDVTAANRDLLDVTNVEQVRAQIGRVKPDLVIHTAAHTDCDQGEREPDLPMQINTIGTWNVVLACGDVGATLAYVSSCGIFDGNKTSPYTELDVPAPLTHHHRSKVRAEEIVASQLREHFILRPGWLFGGSAGHKKNFVAKRHREAVGVSSLESVNDRFGSPTYTVDFARAAMTLIDSRVYGLYHLANEEPCSRFEYVKGCVGAFGLTTEVVPVSSDQFPRAAPVPVSEALDNYFLKLRGFEPMRSWRDAMDEYVNERLIPEMASAK